jgi:hypothetical protein
MTTFIFRVSAYGLALGLMVACGNSPLMNHETAVNHGVRIRAAGTQSSGSTSSCPLEFPKEGLCASVTWDKEPEVMVTTSFKLKFWNKKMATASGPFVSPTLKVVFLPWMPEHGHSTREKPKLEQETSLGSPVPGSYKVSNIKYNMDGQWENHLQLKKEDGTIVEEAVFKLDF